MFAGLTLPYGLWNVTPTAYQHRRYPENDQPATTHFATSGKSQAVILETFLAATDI